MITPYAHYTDEELLRLVYCAIEPDQLSLELAFRLEKLIDEAGYFSQPDDDTEDN